MKKQLISGNFSSIPLATLIASTMEMVPEDEVQGDGDTVENQTSKEEPTEVQ